MAGYIGGNKVVSVTVDTSDITGNITVGGTVDGRDVSVDGTKLDGVEASATADQTKADIEGLGIDLPAANLTGTVAAARLSTATTQAESDDSTKIATTAYVVDKITTLIGGAPSTLNDLNELAAAINDDANYNSTLTTALATKLPLAGGAMTGAITTNSTFDGVDIATRDAVLTTTTNTSNAALPKAGGTITGQVSSVFAGGGDFIHKFQNTTAGTPYGVMIKDASSGATGYPLVYVTNHGGNLTHFRVDSGAGRVGFGTSPSSTSQITIQGPAGSSGSEISTKALHVIEGGYNTGATFQVSDSSSAARFVVDGSGKVGIGIAAPARALHVFTPGQNQDGIIKVGGSAASLGLEISYDQASNTTTKIISNPTYTSANSLMHIAVDGDANPNQIVLKGDGNVGIGIAAPAQPLHVFKAGSANGGMVPLIKVQTSVNNSTGDGSGIEFHGKYQGNEWGFGKIGGANSGANFGGALEFHTNSGNGSSVSTAFTKKMTLDHKGKLGIGVTPHASAKLTLGGTDSEGYTAALRLDNNNTNGAEFFIVATDNNWSAGANKLLMGHGAPSSGNVDITITSGGTVGFGTTNPSSDSIVTISNGGAQGIEFRADSNRVEYMNYNRSANAYMSVRNNGLNFEWYLQNASKMVLDGSGRLLTPYQPSFRAGRSGNYTPNANTAVIFNDVGTGAQHFNIGGHYNTSNGKFTCPVAGRYYFKAIIIFGPGTSDGQDMADSFKIMKNGVNQTYSSRRAEYVNGTTGNGGYYVDHADIIINASANQYIEVVVGRTLQVHGNSNYTMFMGYLIG